MNMTTLILFGSFVLFLVLGLPVSISLGLSSLVSFFYCGIPIVTIAQRLYTGMDSFPLMAIPLFILAGNLMTAGGISRKIVDFANILTGRVRGGLAYTAILACAIFAALSGSGPAMTIAIGAMIYPSMKEIKYPEAQSAGLMAVAGGLGPVIPPSIIMVIYSTLVGCSVTNMFSAGIFWGIFTVIVLAGVVFVISRKDKWPKAGVQKHTARELLGVIARTLPALAVPLIILGGIYSGFFTPTESAGIACVAAYLIGRFVYKEISLHNLPTILVDSAKQSTVIMFIIACATAFSYFFSYAGLTKSLTQFVLSCHEPDGVPAVLLCAARHLRHVHGRHLHRRTTRAVALAGRQGARHRRDPLRHRVLHPQLARLLHAAGRGQPVRHGQHLRPERRRDHQRRDAVLHCQSLRRAAHYFRPRGHRVGRRLKNPCRCEAAPAS